MTEKQLAIANLTRKQRRERKRILDGRRDQRIAAHFGITLEELGSFKRPGPLVNTIPLP